MLKKYENFYKISKGQECNFYQANLREDMKKVLIKRIKSQWSWNEMLKSKSLKIQSSTQYFPKVLQIFKHNGSYFVVYQFPQGPALWFGQQSIKLDISDFYKVCNNILNCMIDLKKEVSSLYVYPEWIFLHRNIVKIAHFEPYFQSNDAKQKKQGHVFLFGLMKGIYKKEEQNHQNDEKRIKNMNFNLGYIAYHLLTGETTQWKQDEKDYYDQMKIIQKSAKTKILYETNDQMLAEIVQKLLTFTGDPNQFQSNDDENLAFQKFKNYLTKKLVDCKVCKKSKEKFRIVEFSLQKMKLQSKMPKETITSQKKKCYRSCCMKKFQEDTITSEQNSDKFRVVESYVKNNQQVNERITRMKTQNLSNKGLRKIKQNTEIMNKFISRKKLNSSCVLPDVSTQRKDKKLQERLKVHQNRSTMFRKSLHSNVIGTPRTYLRTENN